MVDTALLWIGLYAMVAAVGAGAFGLFYVRTREYDLFAVGVAFVGVAGVVELSMANGYLPQTAPFNALVRVCALVGAVVGVIGGRLHGGGFRIRSESTR